MTFQRLSFDEIVKSHDGKIFDKWGNYIPVYERELMPFRDTDGLIVELGVQNGGSLEIWSKYFHNAGAILGIDIEPKIANITFKDSRIQTLIKDATQLGAPFSDLPKPVVIIDDASHQSCDIITSFISLFPQIESGGLYVIEDLCCSYWKGFNNSESMLAMDFFKEMVDCVNKEHWHHSIPVNILDVLKRYDLNEHEIKTLTNTIESIRFYNSMCIIGKSTDEPNSIGERLVNGSHAPLGFQAEFGQNIADVKSECN